MREPPAPSPRVEITEPANEPRIQVNKKRMSVSDANIEKAIQNASNNRESTTCKGASEKTTIDKQQSQNLTRTSPINPQ
jgi:hypothetical protein